MAFFELRQYEIRPGKMDAWLKLFNEEIVPFQIAKGMVVTGSWRGETDDSVFVWMRRFDTEAQREQQYEAVYKSEHWQKVLSPQVAELIDRGTIKVQRITATAASPQQ